MTGSSDSVIVIKTEMAINRFPKRLQKRFETADGETRVNDAVIEINRKTGKVKIIKRIQIPST